MGSWGTGISGNDTAMDLRSEYQAAFYYFDVETALQKIDTYVRKEGFDERGRRSGKGALCEKAAGPYGRFEKASGVCPV